MLKLSDVEWKTRIFLDRNARSFFYSGKYYKGILPTASHIFYDKQFDYLLADLTDSGFIPATRKSNLDIEYFPAVYEQNTEYFYVSSEVWSPAMLKDAALLYLNLYLRLSEYGLGLGDGHCGNIIFEQNCKAKFCDIGSFIPNPRQIMPYSLHEFIFYFFYPILLRKRSPEFGNLMRYHARHGMTHEAAKHLGMNIADYIGDLKKYKSCNDIILSLKSTIESTNFDYYKTTWSGYCIPEASNENAPGNLEISKSPRIGIFSKLIKAIQPSNAVDIGANSGRFSHLLAKQGCQVLALEPDEAAVDRNYYYLREKDASCKVKLAVKQASYDNGQCGDFALALALTHHLFISQHFSWSLIADTLAAYTNNILLTEYMPNGLQVGEGKANPASLPEGYSLELFQKHLNRYFSNIEVIEYNYPTHSPRIFLLCKDKRKTPIDAKMPFFVS